MDKGSLANEKKANFRDISKELFRHARKYIPGGVNSPVRSFQSVGGYPLFVRRGSGSKIYGECGREFIDYCLSWGAIILGHAHKELNKTLTQAIANGTSFGTCTKLEAELAELIVRAFPSVEKVRLTNSGTEAVMSAVRLARAYTGRNKILKFEGSYHGHVDYLLAKAGSGMASQSLPDSLGVPGDFTKYTIVLPYNNAATLKQAVEKYGDDLAAIIVEPVAANCGVILPERGFLTAIKKLSHQYGIILIFDEIITGFRVSYGGAQKIFGIKPDLTCLGKIIGGGFPVGAFGGRAEIMELLAPTGGVYQAGTLSGNPIGVSAGIFTLKALKDSVYDALQKKTERLCEGIKKIGGKLHLKLKVNHIGSMFSIFFTNKDVSDFSLARTQNLSIFKKFYHGLLKEGIYLSPSGYEANFLSLAHSDTDIDKTLKAVDKTLWNVEGQ